ncbi:hypothetical protein ACFXK0_25910 [Nocardia sp. NPDC059177]|uniref:hypothetical protein n=1 Tax=Nocardia sp. NPDC059177 TaxID=3346759 RepID=UPI00367CC152
MRTVTPDPDDVIRATLSPERSRAEVRLPARDLGTPAVDLVKALQLAASLEDEEIVRKPETREVMWKAEWVLPYFASMFRASGPPGFRSEHLPPKIFQDRWNRIGVVRV